jgi:hypothetical protein
MSYFYALSFGVGIGIAIGIAIRNRNGFFDPDTDLFCGRQLTAAISDSPFYFFSTFELRRDSTLQDWDIQV